MLEGWRRPEACCQARLFMEVPSRVGAARHCCLQASDMTRTEGTCATVFERCGGQNACSPPERKDGCFVGHRLFFSEEAVCSPLGFRWEAVFIRHGLPVPLLEPWVEVIAARAVHNTGLYLYVVLRRTAGWDMARDFSRSHRCCAGARGSTKREVRRRSRAMAVVVLGWASDIRRDAFRSLPNPTHIGRPGGWHCETDIPPCQLLLWGTFS